jgi:hypothetical protein
MIMKKYIAIAIIALGALTVASCDKFLDVQTQGYPTQDQFFQNDQQAIDAVDACYARLPQEAVLGRELYWEQACANVIVWGRTRGYPTLATLNYNGDESPLRGVFERAYKEGMNRCNWVIQKLLDKQSQAGYELTAIEKRSLGEAYFLRAYWHFLIAYRYGTDQLGVPFVAYEDVEGGYNNEIPTQQATVMDNYAYIVSDLQKAESLVPKFEEYGAEDRGRIHKAACAALMAKTYAYWATWDKTQWPNVITCVNRLESDYGRDLAPKFADLFAPDFDKFWTKEYCWGWPNTGGSDGGSIEFTGVCLENKGWGKYNGWGQFKPSYDIYEEMLKDGEGNERLKASILEYGDEFQFFGETRKYYSESDVESGFAIAKYMQAFAPADPVAAGYLHPNGDWPCTRVNFPIIRFADCLLLRAEAYLVAGNGGKAKEDINRIRNRSHLTPLTADATWKDLYHERRCELAFELAADWAADCKRWAHSGEAAIKALAVKELSDHPRARHYYGYKLKTKKDAEGKEEIVYPNEYELKDGQKILVSNRQYEVTLYKTKEMKPEDIIEKYLTIPEVEPYSDYLTPVKQWSDKCVTFPYPSEQINKSAGKLKNPPTWN